MVARAPCLVVVVAVAALTVPTAALAAGRQPVSGAAIGRLAARGVPVIRSHVVVVGPVRLPLHVTAPFALDHVTLLGPLIAQSTTFDRLLSLNGSRLHGGANFAGATFEGPASFAGVTVGHKASFDDATFRGSALFGGAHFVGASSFAGAELDGASRFRRALFNKLADFGAASFRDGIDFAATQFSGDAQFGAANFGDVADFSGVSFEGRALFPAARFSALADFISGDNAAFVSFRGARFEGGASFLDREFDGPVLFDLAESSGDMVFDGAEFDALASFSTVRFLGDTTFSQARLYHLVNFDQAVLNKLDFDGAKLEPDSAVVLPGGKDTTGRVDELRFDPNDVGHIGTGTEKSTRAARIDALGRVEAAARRGGDTAAANHAYAARQSLIRHNEFAVLRVANYLGFWGIAGYLVSPLHQLGTLVVMLLAFAAARVIRARWWQSTPVSFPTGLRRTWRALWRLDIRQGTAAASIEATAYKIVFVVLLLNLANVWPPVHDLLRGVLL